jgi:hypothetical protein
LPNAGTAQRGAAERVLETLRQHPEIAEVPIATRQPT